MNEIIKQIVKEAVHEEMADMKAAILAAMNVKTESTDIEGKKAIAKYLNCAEDYVTFLAKGHLLGRMLWKNNDSKSAMLRLCDAPKAKKRYEYIRTRQSQELAAWLNLGAELAENEWQMLNL